MSCLIQDTTNGGFVGGEDGPFEFDTKEQAEQIVQSLHNSFGRSYVIVDATEGQQFWRGGWCHAPLPNEQREFAE